MKKTLLVVLLALTLCLSVVLAACAVPQITLYGAGTGAGTEEDPVCAEVQNGKKTTVKVSLLNATEFVVDTVSGNSATAKVKEGEIEVTGVAVGDTVFAVSDVDKKTSAYLKVTVTPIPATALTLPEFSGEGSAIYSPHNATITLLNNNDHIDHCLSCFSC